jgi:hypothetical protein
MNYTLPGTNKVWPERHNNESFKKITALYRAFGQLTVYRHNVARDARRRRRPRYPNPVDIAVP